MPAGCRGLWQNEAEILTVSVCVCVCVCERERERERENPICRRRYTSIFLKGRK
jgi:hypothetical protein